MARLPGFAPVMIPLLLLSISFWKSGLQHRYVESQMLEQRVVRAQLKLDELRAVSVAAKIDQKKYQDLTDEFSILTGLRLDRDYAVSKGEISAQLSRLIDALVAGLRNEGQDSLGRHPLTFRSVTPGERQVIDPFLSVDFELNLQGRFFAIPKFLLLLSETAKQERCTISVGRLSVKRLEEEGNTGDLSITLPLRAYFLAK